MALQEFFPRCLLDAFRGRYDAMALQNVRNCRSGDAMLKIRPIPPECADNPSLGSLQRCESLTCESLPAWGAVLACGGRYRRISSRSVSDAKPIEFPV